jgi:eukaryotic-like serine/threonine-protein kinase
MSPVRDEGAVDAAGEATPGALDWRGTDRFEVIRCIGRGGMGVVYEARDAERRQRVALKTLLHYDAASLFLLKQEFRTIADVQHRNLVRLHELVAGEGERVFFTMELVRGGTFLAYVQKSGARPGSAQRRETSNSVSSPPEAPASGVQLRPSSPPADAAAAHDAGQRRGTSLADLDRLRPALRQLVEGVRALHSAGKVHRDIKPSNVLVTAEGRVVVLDFGVSTDMPRVADENLHEEAHGVGTARYMAPEQALGEESTPASDWYSVGVMIYEALTGRAPFEGSTYEVIAQKSTTDARPPSTWVDGIPADLDALCLALLDTNPARRPTGAELLRRLGGDRASLPPHGMGAEPGAPSLIGRERQLRSLRDAFDETRQGRAVTVRLSGRAGMGKSALVHHFLDEVVRGGEAVVLRGRAYERESVPYKAVDAVIDALSRHLMHVFDQEELLALPPDLDALARLFPALQRVPAIGDIADKRAANPQQARQRAFGALRVLLSSLAQRRPLVLYIDDVHWGDADSAALLLDLVRPPDAPPMLLIMAHREENESTAVFLSEMRLRWPTRATVHEVSVGALEYEDARRLSLAILGSDDAEAQTVAEAAARESGGSPFLVEELTRSSSRRLVAAPRTGVTLEEMVAERLVGLSADARRLMELVAVGGRPLAVSTVGDAAELAETEEIVSALSIRRFVRTGLRDGREVVEPIHDRIRETIVGLLPESTVRAHHGRLARALEATPGADAEAVAMHLFGAGETARAGAFAARAAKRAAQQLAFDQAARLYARALEALPESSARAEKTRLRLAESLVLAGRGAEAAAVYSQLADGASPLERADFERAAAEQLLMSGRANEGTKALGRILSSWGMAVPASPLSAVFWLLVYRVRLAVRGLQFEERAPESVLPEDRARIDALNAVALGLGVVDVIRSACVQARHLLLALDRGHTFQIMRAAYLEASHLSSQGGPTSPRERELDAIVRRLAEQSGKSEALQAFYQAKTGLQLFFRGHWKGAREVLDAAYVQYPNNRGSANSNFYLFSLHSLWFLGDLVELAKRKTYMLADAEQRGDLYTQVNLRAALPVLTLLADDDVAATRESVTAAMSKWSYDGYSVQHWQAMVMEAFIEIYAGDGARAFDRVEKDERAVKRSFLLKGQFVRGTHEYIRGIAAVAACSVRPDSRTKYLAEARRMAVKLENEQMAWTAPLAAIVSAGASSAAGDLQGAAASLERAIELAVAADMSLYAAAARYQLGRLLDGVRGNALVSAAEQAMRAQDVRAPARFATMLVPGHWTAMKPS